MAKSRILLVEDGPVIQTVVQRMLEVMGNHVDTAENGRDAVDLAAQHRYDLILMDCLMPKMDGFEATRRIRARERTKSQAASVGDKAPAYPPSSRVPIVAITSNAESRQRCLSSGMDDHLRKPFDRTQLSVYLERWLPE